MHGQALQSANRCLSDRHPAIRIAAKEVLLDAHLGCVAGCFLGPWKGTEHAAENWIAKAERNRARPDQNRRRRRRYLFRVAVKAMQADVGLKVSSIRRPGRAKSSAWAKSQIAPRSKPAASRNCNGRSPRPSTTRCKSTRCAAMPTRPSARASWLSATWRRAAGRANRPSASYLLGRTYFRMGAIYADNQHDHRAAILFRKAVPELGKSPPPEALPILPGWATRS